MTGFKDITNQCFGRLKAIKRVGTLYKPTIGGGGRRALWRCQCDCGNKVTVLGTYLRNGDVKSCGCLKREGNPIHGAARAGHQTREYVAWANMWSRCTNPKKRSYRWYGARGIKVCKRWKKFINFLADMGRCPKDYSIERLDPDDDYKPSNCVWIKDQHSTIRSNSNTLKAIWATSRGRTRMLAKKKRNSQSLRTAKARIILNIMTTTPIQFSTLQSRAKIHSRGTLWKTLCYLIKQRKVKRLSKGVYILR